MQFILYINNIGQRFQSLFKCIYRNYICKVSDTLKLVLCADHTNIFVLEEI